MYGWRAKIGHVAPSRGDTLVYEFYKMLPEGFMLLNSTGTIRQLVDADFERQLQRIEEAQRILSTTNAIRSSLAVPLCLPSSAMAATSK